MTVKELIELLEQYDPNYNVLFETDFGQYKVEPYTTGEDEEVEILFIGLEQVG